MKHIYNPLIFLNLFFLFFNSITYSSSEYPYHTNNAPEIRINLNYPQSDLKPLLHFGFSSRHVGNIAHNNLPKILSHNHNYSTKQNSSTLENIVALPLHNNVSVLHYVYDSVKLQRHTMLEQFTHNYPEAHATYFKKYFINETSKTYLSANDIDISMFESCEGNPLQHAIHHEFIMLADTTAHLWNERFYSSEIKELTTVIADFAGAGTSFNHIGEATKAMALADAGWAILDCIQAAGEGIIEGLSVVGSSVSHPVKTIQNFADAAVNCGYYLGIALKEINCVTEAIICGDFDIAQNRYNLWSEHCKNFAHMLSEQCQELTLRDIVKIVARSAIESYATTRAINGFSTFFNRAHLSAAKITNKIRTGAQESTLLMSSEGIPVRIAQETLRQAKKIPRTNDKFLQVLSQFESQKIKIGRITCLLDKKGLKHILERHHPLYWNGSLTKTQTFFNNKTTTEDIISVIKQVIKQNKKLILTQGTTRKYQIDGIIKNITYRVGFDNGRIGQFYIPLKQ
jgi:hypothetical protein